MLLDVLAADPGTYALPGAALLVSMVAVALAGFMGSRSSHTTDQVNRLNVLKDRVDELEEKLSECRADRGRLERQNINLMKRVLNLEENGKDHAP